MPYCDNCGKEVSITDKRCSKCGNELNPIVPDGGVDGGINGIITKIKRFFSPQPHHNIEFILAFIAVLLSVLSLPYSLSNYSYMHQDLTFLILFLLFVAVVGAIIIRYHAKVGAVIILLAGFSLVLFGMQGMFLALIFYIIAAILAFVR